MKAVTVTPGQKNSLQLREVPLPWVEDVPDGRGVLVKVLRAGIDGTDREINNAEYGTAPPGDHYLIIGHESISFPQHHRGFRSPPGLCAHPHSGSRHL